MVRLRRHSLSVTLGVAIVALTPLGYYPWRYWNIPWLAPSLVNDVIVTVKALLPGNAPPSIAVLRFGSPGGDRAAEKLAQGLSEDIPYALGKVSEMFVINAVSVLPYGPSPPNLGHVANDLDVSYLLLGSVQQSGDQLQVTVRLIDGNAGHEVWSKSYPGPTTEWYVLEDKITFDVITEVQVALTYGDMERITASHGTRNLPAWLAAGEGLKLLRHLTPEDNRRARSQYQIAIALDPSYAGASEGLAWTHLLDAEFGWSLSIKQSLAEAQRLTEQALKLDPGKTRLYSLRGHLNLLLRNFGQAVTDGERAVEAERSDADAAALLAFALTYTGDPERAIALVNRAMRLSPTYPPWYGWALGRAYRLAGDLDRAIETLEATLPERPASIIPLVELVIAYGAAGDSGMAKAMAATIREKVPNFSIRAWAAIQPYEDPAMTEQDAAALRSAGLAD
jgi:adenylate cyclase